MLNASFGDSKSVTFHKYQLSIVCFFHSLQLDADGKYSCVDFNIVAGKTFLALGRALTGAQVCAVLFSPRIVYPAYNIPAHRRWL
jgi:hypothetical protein